MASITGRVLSNDTAPRPGVLVAIITGTAPHPDLAAQSDDAGVYQLSGLRAGTYVVGAETTKSAVDVETDDAEVHCDLLLEGKAGSEHAATRSSREDKVSAQRRYPPSDAEPKKGAREVVGAGNPVGQESLGPTNRNGTADESGAEVTETAELEEGFESDPYERDKDPVETRENAPVSISLVERGFVYAILSMEIARGIRDADALTDKAWRTLNPTEDFPISTGDPEFARKSAEWLYLHQEIVRPLIDDIGAAKPKASGSAGPLELVSVRMPKGPTHRLSGNNLKFGLPETIEALKAIAAEWHRDHPGVVLMVRDISREGGGSIQPPHKSHECGLDADCQIWVGKHKVCMKHPRYPEWRPLIQELVDIIRDNGVLSVKAIGFSDREIKNVSHWKGHTCHLHVRFCCPPSKIDEIESYVAEAYADKPKHKRPNYRCKSDFG